MEELHENERMAELPLDNRPRERLFAGGVPGTADLELIPGMGPAKAAVVAAALEFSRRVYSPLPHCVHGISEPGAFTS